MVSVAPGVANPYSLRITLDPSTGLFKGNVSVMDGGTVRSGTYEGIMLLQQQDGAGFLVLPSAGSGEILSGQVDLRPATVIP